MSASREPTRQLFDELHAERSGALVPALPEAERIDRVLEAVRGFALPRAADFTGYQDFGGGVEIAEIHQSKEIVAIVARLAPGAVLAPHDHVGFVGGMTVLEGALRCSDFRYADGERPREGGAAKLVEEGQHTFETGDQSMILSDRGQIHRIEAGPDGVAFFDIYLMHETPGSCLFMRIDDQGRAHATGEVPIE